jgi:hypothetical protein
MSNQIAVPYAIAPKQEQTLLSNKYSMVLGDSEYMRPAFTAFDFRGPMISVRLPHRQACVFYDSHNIEASIIV